MRHLYFTGLLVILSSGILSAEIDQKFIQPFLKEYCISCHNEEKSKGDVSFEHINAKGQDLWKIVLKQLSSGEMPPEDEPQPDKQLKLNVMRYIYDNGEDETYQAAGFRRLNKREYTNTVKDLLVLNESLFDPGEFIYKDEVEDGFDTNASSLVITDSLLIDYLRASERSLRLALFATDLTQPKVENLVSSNEDVKGRRHPFSVYKPEHFILRAEPVHQAVIEKLKNGVQAPGYYTLKVSASSSGNSEGLPNYMQLKGSLKLGVGILSIFEKEVEKSSELIETFEVSSDSEEDFEVKMWLEKGETPYINFLNGPRVNLLYLSVKDKKEIDVEAYAEKYNGPGIKVTNYSLEGPYYDQWPPKFYTDTMRITSLDQLEDESVRERVMKYFIWKSFRRPVRDNEYESFVSYLDKIYKETSNWQESFIRTFSAVMASSEFLYIKENQGKLNDFELASRLSYLMWSTMPDHQLFAAANSGNLSDPKIFQQEVKRMIEDSRFLEFTNNFTNQWLAIDELGSMRPSSKKGSENPFYTYYENDLEPAMREETQQFFAYILNENRSVRDFLDSDYTFVNKALAKFYDIPFQGGSSGHVKTDIPAGSKRGGLLGHASIHTLTANGVETSPVERGHWVLDELLGIPPSPPPNAVAALVPDVNGATTVREQLIKHTEDPTCMQCHRKMDPPGFAMEIFDPIGRVRTNYETDQKIDSSGTYLGQDFKDLDGFKVILLQQDKIFARSLITKIAEYAKGRELNISDMKIVESILTRSSKKGYLFKDMFLQIVTSKLMTYR